MTRPILVNSCARAATAAETRFRLDYPLVPARAVRVIGLDPATGEAVRVAAREQWHHTRFYSVVAATDGGAETGLDLADVPDGAARSLAGELDGVDAVVMVASSGAGAEAAATIGAACALRGIMTAGLLLSGGDSHSPLTLLRRYARMLLVPADVDDLIELLRAIRA